MDRHPEAILKINFQDQGQDSTWWELDKNGFVVNTLFQLSIWGGFWIDLEELKELELPDTIISMTREGDEYHYKYPVESIEYYENGD